MTGSVRFTTTPAVDTPDDLEVGSAPSFDALVAELVEDVFPTGVKDEVPLLLCVAEWRELRRTNIGPLTMGRLFMADFDRLSDLDAGRVLDAAEGLSALFYTTLSHKQPEKGYTNCFRMLLELDREYPAAQHRQVWEQVNARFLGFLDPQTFDVQRPFYLPARRPGDEEFIISRLPGLPLRLQASAPPPGSYQPIDPAGATTTPPTRPETALGRAQTPQPTPEAPLGATNVSRAVLFASLTSWANYRGAAPDRAEKAEVARDAKSILAGKEPKHVRPGEGLRHNWMLKLSGYLARQFPFADADTLCQHFQGLGWDFFQAGDDKNHGLHRLAGMLRDFQASEQAKLREVEEERQAELRRTILASTRGARDYTITEEEVNQLEEKYGPLWRQRVVMQYGSGYFFMTPSGGFSGRMWRDKELMVAARDHFAVFNPEVSMFFEDEQEKLRRHTYETFRTQHATAVERAVYDLNLAESHYDPDTNELSVACAPPVVQPVYHQDVQDWLLWAGGTVLVDMTAGMSRLDKMLPALVITGPGGSGKTLYALAVGRIWGQAPNRPVDTHTRFNDDQTKSQPITLHDEKAGEAYNKEGTSLVREFCTLGERWVEGKNLPKVRLLGYMRLIFAANNPHILDTHESMTAQDREAFAERLVHVELHEKHAEWCRANLGLIQTEWLEKNRMAEHFYWLGKNWEIQNPGPRFLVRGPRTHLHDGLTGGAGTSAEVIQWLLGYVSAPSKVTATGDSPLEMGPGYLRVTAAAVLSHWEKYLKSQIPRRTSEVQGALRSISHPGFQKIFVSTGGGAKARVNAYDIDLEILRANLDRHHLTEEEFTRALGLTKEKT